MNRPAYRRAGSGEPSFPFDPERAHRARQAAEALFAPKPKPRVTETGTSLTPAPVERRALAALPASPAPAAHRPADPATSGTAPQPERQIPSTHAARIRTWLRYGMSKDEVAAVYGVQIGDIERILERARETGPLPSPP